MYKCLFSLIGLFSPMLANAYDDQIDGIYYVFDKNEKTASVTYFQMETEHMWYGGTPDINMNGDEYVYSGTIIIPEQVVYNGESYDVTSIGESAFSNCNK